MLVEEIQKQPAGSEIPGLENHSAERFGTYGRESAEEKLGNGTETYYCLGEIDGDGVHADHAEESRKLFPASDVDAVVENGEHRDRIRSCNEDESTGPHALVYREPY